MIILATAIILSLSNSGIISKANKAKTDSDTANLKEYVNTLRAEWELMTDAKRTASGNETFEDYANKKLEENGYKQRLSEDGTLMNEAATTAVKAGIKVGDVVTGYNELLATKPEKDKTYTIVAETVGTTDEQKLTTNTDYIWKYMGISKEGDMLIVPDIVETSNTVKLDSAKGYLNGPTTLNNVCEKLYSVSEKGIARSIDIDDVTRLLEYTGPKGGYFSKLSSESIKLNELLTIKDIINQRGEPALSNTTTPDGKDINTYKLNYYEIYKTSNSITVDKIKQELVYQTNAYWLSSTCTFAEFRGSLAYFYVRYVIPDKVYALRVFGSNSGKNSGTYAVRPVVTLNSNVKLTPNADKTEWAIS